MSLLPTSGVAANGKPILDWNGAANQLTRTGNSWAFSQGQPATVTYAFRATAPSSMPDGTGGFQPFTAAQILAAEAALELWSDVANITFVRVGSGSTGSGAYSNSATILFANYLTETDPASGFAFMPSPGQTAAGNDAGDIWIDFSQAENANPVYGDFGPHVLAHEIGHAIGINHPGNYNGGSPDYAADAVYWQDSRMFTVMSYFGSPNAGGNLPTFAWGPQYHDIAAAQLLYGANMTTRTGDTIYGFNSNSGRAAFTLTSASQGATFSIWDAGGNDTLDLSGFTEHADIDLRPGAFSSAGPTSDAGPAHLNLSIAVGVVIENAVGGAGNDTITGNAVANLLIGGAGVDSLIGDAGDDQLSGDEGPDTLLGGIGADTIDGGAAADHLSGGDGDDLILGGAGSDHIFGGLDFDRSDAGTGADWVEGGAGDDSLYGGNGGDTIHGDDGFDTLSGGVGKDSIYGDADNDLILGGDTGDIINGGSGADTLYGEAGSDTIDGGDHNDLIIAASGRDSILGGVGDDSVDAGAGDDIIDGQTGRDGLAGGNGLDTLEGGGGNDTLQGGGDADTLTGSGGYDVLLGDDGDDQLAGGDLNDILLGGAGDDLFLFAVGDNTDTLRDFTAGDLTEDVIALIGFGAAFDLFSEIVAAASDDGTNTTIDFGNGDLLIIQNVVVAALSSDDFTFG